MTPCSLYLRLATCKNMKTLYRAVTVAFIVGFLAFLSGGGPTNQEVDETTSALEEVDETTSALEDSEETTSALEKVDGLLNQGENEEAWKILQALPEDDSKSAESLWRMARTQYEMGQASDQKNAKLFKSAEKYTRAAIKKDPNSSESYKWLAIALGAQSKYSGTKEQVRQSGEIKENIEKAIELNPDDDIAYLVLSRWHYKVSALSGAARTFARIIYGGVPKASIKKAEDLLLQAIKIHDRVAHRYNLAKVYKRMDRREEAMEQLRLTLLLPVTFPEEVKDKEKARKKQQSWK
jgi:tetratricopeptide (TPR) repeat protein